MSYTHVLGVWPRGWKVLEGWKAVRHSRGYKMQREARARAAGAASAAPTLPASQPVPRRPSGAGYVAVVQELLALGARPDVRNRQGATPLSFAALRGHTRVMDVLLDARADATTELPTGAAAVGS